MIEDFLAHTPSAKRCTQFEEVADVICKQGFRMFLGMLTGDCFRMYNLSVLSMQSNLYIQHSSSNIENGI